MPSPLHGLAASIALTLLTAPLSADVRGWRMDGDGRYPDARPPLSWSSDDNVAWKTALPSWSNASPVLIEEQNLVIVLAEPDRIFGLDTQSGAIRWQDAIGDVARGEAKAHKANGRTTATPVTDGAHVFSVYGSGVVAAHDLEGERAWARSIGKPDHRWGASASPVLGGGNLIVHLVDVIALDPATGAERWRATSDPRWGSPVITTIDGTDVVILPAGDVFRADDGTPVASDIGGLAFATPVVQDGIVYFIEKKATAVRLPAKLDGVFQSLWTSRIQGSRHYASSVIHDGLVYAVSREQQFTILDAETGAVVHERKLDLDDSSGANSAYPSITLGGAHLFVSTENGTTATLRPGRTYDEVARSAVEGFRSSPVFAGERIFLRAFDHLYCFADDSPDRDTTPEATSR